MQQRDIKWPQYDKSKLKSPWSHCVRWLLQETSPLKYRKPRCYGTSPELSPPQTHPASEDHLFCRYPVPWQPEGRQLDRATHSANPPITIRGCANTDFHLWEGDDTLFSPNFCHHLHLSNSQAQQRGKLLGHSSPRAIFNARMRVRWKVPVPLHSPHRQAGTTTGVGILSK